MLKKLTNTVDAEIYDGLHRVVGRRRISRFLNDLARPHVIGRDLALTTPRWRRRRRARPKPRNGARACWRTSPANRGGMGADRSPCRGEVSLVAFDPSVGGETRKTRPGRGVK